jgi:hypothetical protein
MQDPVDPHPSLVQLTAFDTGRLPEGEREAVERHIKCCPECSRTLDALPEDSLGALVRAFGVRRDSPDNGADETSPDLAAVPAELVGHPRYRVLGVLGAGGMGVVYKAVHRLMDRVVALKVLRRSFTERPALVERFRREVRAAARLDHPNIVAVHDADQAGDLHFLVMEYVPGVSLDREVGRRGSLPMAEACDLIRQAALALEHAHERGMVHRDVKPANLMRLPDGRVKLLDFGLAEVSDEHAQEAQPAGTVVGTPDYLAPEQARDPRQADARSDVYGLGCTLYHLLVGQPPFPEATPLGTLLAHQERAPRPVTAVCEELPAALVRLLDRMLSKDPTRRPALAEVAGELAPLAGLAEHGVGPGPAGRTRGRLRWLWALAAPVAAALVVAAWAARHAPPAPSSTASTTPEPEPAPAVEPDRPPVRQTPQVVQVVTLQPGPVSRQEMREQVLTWIKDNNRWGPQAEIVELTAEDLDERLERIDGFLLGVGPDALKSRHATRIAAHPGGVFLVELPDELAQEVPLRERQRVFRPFVKGREQRPAQARVSLSELTVQDACRHDGGAVTGSVAFRVLQRSQAEYALRLTYYHAGARRTVIWYPKERLADEGVLNFSFPPMTSPDFRPRGPVLIFVEVSTRQDGKVIIESNAAAALLRLPFE